MENQELLNDLCERVERIVEQQDVYMDLAVDILSIETSIYISLDNISKSNLALLNKLLHEKNLLIGYGICSFINSPIFFFNYKYIYSSTLTLLITYLDIELDCISRIVTTYENLHKLDRNSINDFLLSKENSLINEFLILQKSKAEWINLMELICSDIEEQ